MNNATKEQLIAFEGEIRDLWEAGEIPCLLHLCGGNEDELLDIFAGLKEGDWVFSTHRNHYHALLAGLPPAKLKESILSGDSMFTFSKERNFYSSAILAGCCGIAAGVAWSLKRKGSLRRVVCFLGDGAEEQGHFYEAALFVEAHGLPCTFIIEDNRRQVETPKSQRRGIWPNANAPLDHFKCVKRYYYDPVYPHSGSGRKEIKFNPDAVQRYLEKKQQEGCS